MGYRGQLRKVSDLPRGRLENLSMHGTTVSSSSRLLDSHYSVLLSPFSALYSTLESLVNKLNHLQLFLSKNEPDLLLVTETWLTCKIKNSEVSSHLPYDVVRLDRNDKRGGGVCCVIKNTLTSRIVRHDIRCKADVLCVDILPQYEHSLFDLL
ncbi:hypothetical protein COOONC_05086 [Cooperia oncophora]